MHFGLTTLSKFLIQQLSGQGGANDLAALLVDVAAAVKAIAAMTAKGALTGFAGKAPPPEVLAHDAILRSCEWGGLIAGMASKALDEPYALPSEFSRGPYLLTFDALDGAPNTDVNVSVGSIFSVLRHRTAEAPLLSDYLQSGAEQVAAGYAIYGPATMLVVTVGRGTHGFTLDREIGNFILTHPNLAIPEECNEFAIDSANARFWEPPVQRYVTECQAGRVGDRGRDFNMRWIASLVAEVHRILMRGGVFMSPKDTREATRSGRLRLLFEASPIALLIEQAQGRATTGRDRLLDIVAQDLHERVPLIFGSRCEVERIGRYHAEHASGLDRPYSSPLFNERSMFRSEAWP